MSILLYKLVSQEGKLELSFSLMKADKKYKEYIVLDIITNDEKKKNIVGEKWVGWVSNQNISSGL